MDITIVLNQLITLFLIIGLGYLLYKLKMMNQEFDRTLTKIILNITMPLMIINSVLTQEEKTDLSTVLFIFGIAVAMYMLLPVVGWLLAKVLFVPKQQLGLYVFMTVFSNVGFMGFPLITALLGNTALFYASLFNIIFNLSCYSYGIVLVNYGLKEKARLNAKMLLTPGILLSLLALVLYLVDAHFPTSVTTAIGYIGNLTSPLAMLLIGASLASMNLKEIFNDWRVYVYTILKQLVFPLAVFPLLRLFIHDELILSVSLIMLSVPVANTAVLFSTQYHADEKLAARVVFITTLCSLVTIPVVIMLCKVSG